MAKRAPSRESDPPEEENDQANGQADEQPGTVDYREAAVFLGVGVPQLFKYVDQHKLTPQFKKPGKPSRFWLTDLEELKERKAKDEEDGGGDKLTTLVPVAQLITVMTGLVKQAEDHATKTLGLVMGPSKDLHEKSLEAVATLSSELERTHKKYFELLSSQEKMMAKVHERELERMREMSSERRKDQMLGMLRQAAPTLIGGITGHVSKNRMAGLAPLFDQLLSSVDDATLMKIASDLPENARLPLMRIIQVVKKDQEERKKAEAKPVETPNANTNGAPAPPPSPVTTDPEKDAVKKEFGLE